MQGSKKGAWRIGEKKNATQSYQVQFTIQEAGLLYR